LVHKDSHATVTYGVTAFQLWEYSVSVRAARQEMIEQRRPVYLMPDGTLVFTGRQGDSAKTHHYDAGMVKLAASPQAASVPGRPGMTYRDLTVEDFGQHQGPGFRDFSKTLLDRTSR
jgi:hypothetical protein